MPPLIKSFDGFVPQIDEGVFIADGATVVGHVELGKHVTVWYGAVLRGDVGPIVVGEGSTIQDLACLHMKRGGQNVVIGRHASIGHGAIVHGAIIDDGVLIGNGAIVLDRAHIGEGTIVAAGAMVARGTVIPPRCLVRGRPGQVVRELTAEEALSGKREAELQYELSQKSE